MSRIKTEIHKLRELAKDDSAFEELKSLFFRKRMEGLISFVRNTLGPSKLFFFELQIILDDLQTNTYYSENVKDIIGIPHTELENNNKLLNSLIYDDDIIKVKKITAEIKNTLQNNNYEVTFRINNKKDETVWLRKNVYVYVDESEKTIFSIYTNITNFIEREEALMRLKETYRSKNAAKDKFISIVSHDLRAPFTSLLGFSEILLKENNISSDEAREYLEYIYDAAKTELQLINDLLDWSRLQTGKITLNIRRIRLSDVINNATSILTGNAIRKNVTVKIDVSNDIYVLADDRLLGQAIKNLLSNAIKFTPPGKSIHITAGKFNEGIIEVILRDEGIGIPEKHQDKIFKIDEKFSLEGTEGEKGSGLGLTLVKEIIDKHKGNIWFYSKENEGTEFHFTLPEAHTTIIVVDDDMSNRKLLVQILKDSIGNCDIIEAANGYEALTKMEKETPSLIVTDHEMPLMNGFQLVEAAKKKISSNHLPVIIVSGKLNKELRRKYHEIGVEKIVEKPILPEEFGKTVKQLLG